MIAERIVNCFSDTKAIINGRPTKLNDDPENKISAHDQFVYLTMILAAPSQNFHAQFKSVIDNSTDKAPTFGQEYAARLLWSKVQNPELFNLTMSALIAKLPKDSSLYMKTKSILDNVHIYGGAGVGKTRGVASWVKNMFPEAGIITCAPTDVQVENLNQAIDHGKGPSYTKEELLRFILDRKDGSLFSDDDVVEITEEVDDKKTVVGITTKANIKISDSKIFTESNPTILFIDEVGVFNRIELEIIHRYAKKHNILVFGFGDYKQNSDRVDFFGKKQYSNMEDCFVFYAPELVAPFRPGNAAQLDNYNAMTEALDSAYDIYYENPEIPINKLDKFVSEKYGTNPILLK